MAFDKTQPTNSTKLRNIGTVIRPNWVAIEEGDSSFKPTAFNLADRDDAGIASDPTAIAKTIILYSKDDGTGRSEGYAIDPSSKISHLTGIKAWCRFVGNAASPITPTDGFNVTSITHAGVGSYTVNFINDLQNADYAVFMMSSSGTPNMIVSTAKSNTVVRTSSLAQPTIVTVMVIGN